MSGLPDLTDKKYKITDDQDIKAAFRGAAVTVVDNGKSHFPTVRTDTGVEGRVHRGRLVKR